MTEKLERIAARCRELLADGEVRATYDRQAISGWHSTLAAIESCLDQIHIGGSNALIDRQMSAILAAWTDDLL